MSEFKSVEWDKVMTWGPIPSPRYSSVSWIDHKGDFYVFGGVIDPRFDDYFVLYKLHTKKWLWSIVETQGDVPNIDRQYANREYVCYDDGYLYVLSPIVERHGVVNNVHCYRLNNKNWNWEFFVCSSKLNWVDSGSLVCIDGHLLLFGGIGHGFSNLMSVLDTNTWEWSISTDLRGTVPQPRAGHSAVSKDNFMFVIGGYLEYSYGTDYYSSNLFFFDYDNQTWQDRRYDPRNQRVEKTAMCLNDEFVFLFGGTNKLENVISRENDMLQVYDIELKKWAREHSHSKYNLPSARFGSAMGAMDDRVILFGGAKSKNENEYLYMNDTYCFSIKRISDTDYNTGEILDDTEIILDTDLNVFSDEVMLQNIDMLLLSNKLKDKLDFAYFSDEYKDMLFQVGEETFYANQIILVNTSVKFKEIFRKWYRKKKTGILTITIDEEWDGPTFKKFLRYLYSGRIEIANLQEAKLISEMAYDYLIDSLLSFSNSLKNSTFPAVFEEEDSVLWRQLRKSVGSNIGSDIYFVVENSKKLLSHKILLFLFSTEFRTILEQNPDAEYFEYSLDEVDEDSFISYLRVLYSNYSRDKKIPDSAVYPLFLISNEVNDIKLLRFLENINNISPNNLGQFLIVSKVLNNEVVYQNCLQYFKDNFEDLSRNKKAIGKWSKGAIKLFAKHMTSKNEIKNYNWLDILWFSHISGLEQLESQALSKLSSFVNLDNVISVLVASHHCGAKDLRNLCVEMMVSNSEFLTFYNRESDTPYMTLSDSLSINMVEQFRHKPRVGSSSHCSVCGETFGLFSSKKHSCELCSISLCNNCGKTRDLPLEFGFHRPIYICEHCESLVTLFSNK